MAHMKKFFKKVADRIDKLDAADRRHQFEALANEIGFLESVFNTLSEGVLVIDASGMLMYSNSIAERLAACPFSRGRGKPIRDMLPGWDWDRLLNPSAEGAGWARKASCEIEIAYPERRILELGSLPNGSAVVVIIRDVTGEQRRTRARANARTPSRTLPPVSRTRSATR